MIMLTMQESHLIIETLLNRIYDIDDQLGNDPQPDSETRELKRKREELKNVLVDKFHYPPNI